MSLNLLTLTNIVGSTSVVEATAINTDYTLAASGSHKRVNSILISANGSSTSALNTYRVKIDSDTYCVTRISNNNFVECIPNGPIYLNDQQSVTISVDGTVDSSDPPTCTISYEVIS